MVDPGGSRLFGTTNSAQFVDLPPVVTSFSAHVAPACCWPRPIQLRHLRSSSTIRLITQSARNLTVLRSGQSQQQYATRWLTKYQNNGNDGSDRQNHFGVFADHCCVNCLRQLEGVVLFHGSHYFVGIPVTQ